MTFLATGSGTLLLAGVLAFGMADKPATVITPDGSPVWLDSQRSFFFDAPSLWVAWRNELRESVNYALRIWIFDERSQLKGTLDYCGDDILGSHTRGRTLIPVDIPGVTLRDRAVVAVVAAAADKVAWRLRETGSEQIDAALIASKGSPARLSFERDDKYSGSWNCPAR